ncbi:Lamin-like protein [Cucurbita argyrosperma subsp. argyrosperma]|uniref:Lamin-like protein n=2 Tax=Cucurbita TaxID=3660 RepID=A0A6J1EHP8_CUCMO
MEEMRVRVIMVIVAMAWATLAMGEKLHKVGNSKGWNPNLNYTLWSSSHRFYLGDWLYFVFDKRYYNVLEVNKTSYESCNEKEFIKNITRGGRDVFQLTELRPYFFIAGGGYCFQGMKLAVLVCPTAVAPAAPPSATPISGASLSNPTCWIMNALMLFVALFLVIKIE